MEEIMAGEMKVKEFTVQLESFQLCDTEIGNFLKTWHYSKNIKGLLQEFVFSLRHEGELIGVCLFGTPAGINTPKYYAEGKNPKGVYELRRLCLIDETPKNAESYFIGKCLRYLKKNTKVHTILSYADPNKGHTGVIYRASNFEYRGVQTTNCATIEWNGKLYHGRVYGNRREELKKAFRAGEAKRIKLKPKHIYTYNLRKVA